MISEVLKKSINIDGRAGCGKSTLIKKLQEKLKLMVISYILLAPTNKAANITKGGTIHRFVASHSPGKLLKN